MLAGIIYRMSLFACLQFYSSFIVDSVIHTIHKFGIVRSTSEARALLGLDRACLVSIHGTVPELSILIDTRLLENLKGFVLKSLSLFSFYFLSLSRYRVSVRSTYQLCVCKIIYLYSGRSYYCRWIHKHGAWISRNGFMTYSILAASGLDLIFSSLMRGCVFYSRFGKWN